MPSKMLPIEQILILLEEAPRRIAALTTELAPARLHTAPNDDEWSANDVLAHLRACADVWGSSIVTMANLVRARARRGRRCAFLRPEADPPLMPADEEA